MKKKKEKDYYVSIIAQRVFDPDIGMIEYRDITIVYSIYRNSNKLVTLLDFSTEGNYYHFLKRYIGKTLPIQLFFKRTGLDLQVVEMCDDIFLEGITDDDGARLLFELNYK